jgi:hypothetical protein
MAKVIFREIKGSGHRKISIQCKVDPKYIMDTSNVEGFFIYYQPIKVVPQARILLAGFVETPLWTNLNRIRMFPQFKKMLESRDARGIVGEGMSNRSLQQNHRAGNY